MQSVDEVVMVGGSTRIPKVQELVKEYFGKEPHKGVNPDEVVAIGAAVQAGVLSGEVKDLLLLDVTPAVPGHRDSWRGLHQADREEHHDPHQEERDLLHRRRQPDPAWKSRCSRARRPMAEPTTEPLGVFHLVGIPAAPRGVPQIEVTFDIDANGIVNVSAKDMGTGKEQKITITSSSGLSKNEIDNMVNEAEVHAEEDKTKQQEVELKNRADTLIYSTEKTLKEHRDKVDEADAKNIEDAVESLKKAVEANDTAAIEQGIEQLTTASHKLAEVMYQQASTEPGAPGEAGAGAGETAGAAPSEEDVIDAEYEDVDDKQESS